MKDPGNEVAKAEAWQGGGGREVTGGTRVNG